MNTQSPLLVLVVDDDPDLLSGTCQFLEQAGYATTQAANGAEALASFRARRPHLVLLDRKLPDMDGLEVCRQIKADVTPENLVLVVMISGLCVEESFQLGGLEAGADGYIVRPIGRRELLVRLEAFARIVRLTRRLSEEAEARRVLEAELEKRVRERTADLEAANRSLEEGRRATLNLVEDAIRSRAEISASNQSLRAEITKRQQTETELTEAQVQLEEFFDLVPDLVCVASTDGYFRRLNPAWETALGYSRPELMAKPFEHFIHPDDVQPTRDEVARQIQGQETIEFQNRYRAKDGAYRWLEWQATPAVGGVLYAAARDITDRKKAQEALIESERHFRTLADSGQALVWTSGVDKKCDYFNQPWLDFTGRTMEQELGDGWAEGVHPDDLQRCFDIYSGAFDRRERFSMVYRLRRADGEYRWIQDDGTPRFDVAGKFLGFIGHCLDITERMRADESLRESEQRFRLLAEGTEDFVTLFDAEWQGIFNGPAYFRRTGWTQEDLEASDFTTRVHPDDLATVQQARLNAAAGETVTYEHRCLCKDGSWIWLETHIKQLPAPDGRMQYFSTSRDITKRRKAEDSLLVERQRLAAIIKGADVGTWEWNVVTGETVFNERWAGILGYTLAELEPVSVETWKQLAHPEDLVESMALLERHFRGQLEIYECEQRMRHKDGSWVWIMDRGQLTSRTPDGRPLLMQGVHIGITRRKQAEEALKQLNAELEQRVHERTAEALDLYNNAPCGYHSVGPDGIVLQMNDTELGWLGYSREEVEGRMRLADLMTPASAALFEERFRNFRQNDSREVWEWEMRCRDGSTITILVNAAAVRDAEGHFIRSRSAVLNITERKRLENSLRESEEKFRLLFDSSRDAIVLTDTTGRCLDCNKAAVAVYGAADKAEVLARGPLGYCPARQQDGQESGPAFGAHVSQALTKGSHFCEWWHQRPDGTVFPAEISISVANIGGQVVLQGVVHDISRRRAAERNLRESEEQFRTVFDSSLDAIITADTTGRCVACNPAAVTMFGFPDKEALLACNLLDLAPAKQSDGRESREVIAEKIKEIMAAGGAAFAWTHRRADGSIFPSEVSIALSEIRGQRLLHGIVRDVTERQQAQEKLRQSKQRLRDIVETVPDWVWEVDENGIYTFSGPQSVGLLGYTENEILGRTPFDFMPTEEAQRLMPLMLPIMGRGEPIRSLENVLQRKDGRLVFVETNGVPIFDASGKLRGYRGLDHDITERRRAEAQLRQLHSAVEQSPTVVLITDRNGTIEYVNPQFSEQTGYAASEVIGKNTRILRSGQHSTEFYQELWKTLLEGQTWRGELCNKRKDGTFFWEFAAIAPIRDRTGKLTHYVAIKEDITKSRRLVQELRQAKEAADAANRAKGIFLANMSHEIRTPLNAVLGFAQLMQRDATLTAIQRQRMESINRNGNHLLQLISDVLDMARIESGRVQLSPSDCNFRALVQDTHATFRMRAEEKHLRFDIQVSDEVPTHLHTDAVRVRQVLINMLGNAIKFTAKGGISLRVTAEPAQTSGPAAARLCLEVADTGVGIAADEVGKVFAAFEQTLSGQREGTGTGLGMAISRQLARLLGGDLTVTSQLGVGSTFRFTFVAIVQSPGLAPLAGAVAQDGIVKLQPGVPPPKVLVVDDIASNREILRTLLESAGFIVEEAPDGAEAVEYCAENPPTLVLMDRRMPGMDGLTAIRAIRSGPAGRDTRILVVSADLLGTAEKEWKEAGADGFLSKPFQMDEVLTRIGALLKLKYVTAEPSAALAETPSDVSSATRDLPPKVRADLRRAIESGDINGLRKILEQTVVPLNQSLGNKLSRLADNYDYTGIMQALKE